MWKEEIPCICSISLVKYRKVLKDNKLNLSEGFLINLRSIVREYCPHSSVSVCWSLWCSIPDPLFDGGIKHLCMSFQRPIIISWKADSGLSSDLQSTHPLNQKSFFEIVLFFHHGWTVPTTCSIEQIYAMSQAYLLLWQVLGQRFHYDLELLFSWILELHEYLYDLQNRFSHLPHVYVIL